MPTVFEEKKKEKILVNRVPLVERTIMTPLTSFAVSPEGIRFETQEKEEKVVLFLRQHLVVLLGPTLLVILLALSPVLLFPFLLQFLTLPIDVPIQYVVVGTAFWYVVTFGYALMSFLRWFFNIYVVTDKRIVDIDFLHLLYKEFSEARLERIQDINFKSGGIFAAFFDYGDAYVQTAAEMPNIEFVAVPQPAKVVETISDLLEKQKISS
ncbi:MAG: PH domain-containing protein [Patescibacteria group bacterium]